MCEWPGCKTDHAPCSGMDDDDELEPGEAERMAGFLTFGLMLADLIVHPEGTRALMQALEARGSG